MVDSGISSHLDLNGNYDVSNALDFFDLSTTEPNIGKMDINSHGTHVAGIIGAEGNNGIGISSINWDVSLVQLRSVGASTNDAIVNAIDWAKTLWDTDNRISILNFSAGTYSPLTNIESSIREYCEKGGLFICSTGNKPQDNDMTYHYPSFYGSSLHSDPIANMITVGRIDINDTRPNDANWGLSSISVYAPGEDILSTFPENICLNNSNIVPTAWGDKVACECKYQLYEGVYQWVPYSKHKDNGYHYMSGSSMSTPHVSGVAALLLSVNPNLTATQIKSCIMNGADDITITIGDGTTQEVKKLNAWGAFQYLMENYPRYEIDIGYYDRTYSYNIDAGASYMKDHTAMMKFNSKEAGNYTFTITSDNPIEVKLYDHELNEIAVTRIKRNVNREIEITYNLSDDTTYYLRTNYINSTDEGSISLI